MPASIIQRKVANIMPNENSVIVVPNQKINLKSEAKKQLNVAADDCLRSLEKPAKDFTGSVIHYCINSIIDWVDKKLSA